ncbi:helix-turn-helix domain-containing protein [Streptomyces cinnabarinus]|uniref:Helix-turn-helix domain-containing protein n=1 Tax=Streptomyces cinnabarinus TaxID=67287 RepID=A0ABY7KSY0_9ACTN|nr:helix-turn-helix domain-containing protein [Streptomyces cinnabarinus]WAZ26705.1 helix-turn-helix domain-containing protein [Streptomyces cinnabarinus]
MTATVLSTEPIPAKERLAYWHEMISRIYDELASVRMDIALPVDAPYRGTITATRLGSLHVATTDADPQRFRQTKGVADGPGADYVNVCWMDRGVLALDQNDHRALLRPGSLLFFDTSHPHRTNYPVPFRQQVIQVPRWMLGLREGEIQRLTSTPIGPDTDTSALVIQFLSQFATKAAYIPPHIGDLLARNTADLLATLIAERLDRVSPDTGTDAARTALRLRIKGFIDRNLADPDLSPQMIADAHRISVRYLHWLFQNEETTVSRWILHRRLAAGQRDLARSSRSALSVAAVAHRWGFTSPSHFSRAFRAAYGMTPREWRAGPEQDRPILLNPPGGVHAEGIAGP